MAADRRGQLDHPLDAARREGTDAVGPDPNAVERAGRVASPGSLGFFCRTRNER
jgi:hypothetical protein